MTAHLLTIGDEILIGQITDTNSAWMSRELNLRGIRVSGKSSVGDEASAIVAGLDHASAGARLVISTGGLGPTKDDLTKQTLAAYFNSRLVFHQEIYDRIAAYFARIERPMPPSMHEQSM
ncbi:MAG TPA: competence/damage-inducible protein A, partial [Saprospiraceae bacterium]|nr:competence/damage-inducible protein A [Saprospiraceae bacterium]